MNFLNLKSVTIFAALSLSGTTAFAEGGGGLAPVIPEAPVVMNFPEADPEPVYAVRESVDDVFKDTKTGNFTLKSAGPLVLGLGAIIAIGALSSSGSTLGASR